MNPIQQEDLFGCGVACVAFILNIEYFKAKGLFKKGKYKARNSGFYCREIVDVLKRTRPNCTYKYIKPKIKNKIYQDSAIVFIKKSKNYPFGHYLVRDKNGWMDPWINFPDENIRAGFRKRLPGKAIYVIY